MQNRVRDAKKEDLWSLMNQGSGIPRGYEYYEGGTEECWRKEETP